MNGELERAKQAGKLLEAGPGASEDAPARRSDGSEISADAFTKLGLLGKGAVGKCYLVREKVLTGLCKLCKMLVP